MFRNESEAVIGKVKARENTKAKAKEKRRAVQSPSTSSSSPMSSSSIDEVDPESVKREVVEFTLQQPDTLVGGFVSEMVPIGALSLPPNIHLQHRAQAFFYSKSPLWLQNYDLLGTLCTQTTADEHLLASMSAVGLATLSNSLHTPELLNRSRKDYITALHLTNAALRSPTDVKKDSTLFSVMILSIYETITGSDSRSLSAWTKHVNGATALVKLRGREQFKSNAGQRMFLQVLSYLMLSCIQRTLPMPAHMIELRQTAARYMDNNKSAWQASGAIIDFTVLRAAIRNGDLVGPKNIIEQSLALDKRFANIFTDPPEEFKYKKVYTTDNPHLVWNGMYHVYATHSTAQIWNGTRTCRILLHEGIRDQILVDLTAMEPYFTVEEAEMQNSASVEIMMECQRDILASVPQHTSVQNPTEPTSLLEGSRAYFILWPLYLVGVMDLVTEDVRNWVVQRLRGLADVAGISQAKVLGDYIAAKENPWEWDTKPVPNIKRGIVERSGSVVGFEEWDSI